MISFGIAFAFACLVVSAASDLATGLIFDAVTIAAACGIALSCLIEAKYVCDGTRDMCLRRSAPCVVCDHPWSRYWARRCETRRNHRRGHRWCRSARRGGRLRLLQERFTAYHWFSLGACGAEIAYRLPRSWLLGRLRSLRRARYMAMAEWKMLPLGVDLGSTRVRIALVEASREGSVRIRAIVARDLPDAAVSMLEIEQPALVAAVLEEMLDEIGSRQRHCVLALGAPACTLRIVRFPKDELGGAVARSALRSAAFFGLGYRGESDLSSARTPLTGPRERTQSA